MHTLGILVSTRQITEFYTFRMSSALIRSPSTRCVIAENDMKIFEETFSIRESV
jgi:hypothetical protein